MKILTDKVYLKGQELIVNNWPEKPKFVDEMHAVENLHHDRNMREYKASLTRAIEEGYVVQTHFYELLPTQDPLTARSHQFYTLPEPREFECEENFSHCTRDEKHYKKVATLLPKEEIKPAPLGESSEEQKPKGYSKLINSTIGSHHWMRTMLSFIMRSGEYLSEHGSETKDEYLRSWGTTMKAYAEELHDHYESISETVKPSPTSEPPEEQEELCKFIKRNLNGHTEFRVVVMDNGKAYAHVLGRDSETFDFKI